MRLLIITLTIIFVSFGASAKNTGGVEQYYKFCKPYVANGLSTKGMTEDQVIEFLICNNVLVVLMKRGDMNCKLLNGLRKQGDINDKQFSFLSMLTANEYVSPNPLITSFVTFAENNPDKWNKTLVGSTFDFLNRKFPCKLDK